MSTTGQPIAALYATMLTDDDVAELSNDEFRLWIMALVKAANDRSRGVVKVGKPALVQRWACLPDGKDACAQAVTGLLEKGRLVRDEDGTVRIRNWDRYQAPVSGLLETGEDDYVAPDPDAPGHGDDESGLPTLADMSAQVRGVIEDELPTARDPLSAYAAAFQAIEDLLTGLVELEVIDHYAKTDGKGRTETPTQTQERLRANLRFACVQHAIGSIYGSEFPAASWGRVRRKVKALGPNGNHWVITAALTSAGQNIEGDLAGYILATATRLCEERRTQLRAQGR